MTSLCFVEVKVYSASVCLNGLVSRLGRESDVFCCENVGWGGRGEVTGESFSLVGDRGFQQV